MNTMNAITAIAITMTKRMNTGRQCALTPEFERSGDRRRQFRHDARDDDERDAVADAARGDLLAEPHQEHRPAGQRDDRRETEEPARFGDDIARALKPDRDGVGLEDTKDGREIARILIDDLAALLAFLLELLKPSAKPSSSVAE
jgi:hypothetical protein